MLLQVLEKTIAAGFGKDPEVMHHRKSDCC